MMMLQQSGMIPALTPICCCSRARTLDALWRSSQAHGSPQPMAIDPEDAAASAAAAAPAVRRKRSSRGLSTEDAAVADLLGMGQASLQVRLTPWAQYCTGPALLLMGPVCSRLLL